MLASSLEMPRSTHDNEMYHLQSHACTASTPSPANAPGVFRSRCFRRQVNVFLTYMGDRYLELEDVDNVHLKLHPLVYTNKTWTPRKLLLRMRRDVILDVLSQVCAESDTDRHVDGYAWWRGSAGSL